MDSSPQNQCRECRRVIETARFCVFCGVTQDNGATQEIAQGSTCCRRCGQADPLNSAFCTFCGHQRVQATKMSLPTTAYVEPQIQAVLSRTGGEGLRDTKKISTPKRKKNPTGKYWEITAITVAATVLLTLCCIIISKSLAAKASLLVHVNYPRADVILQDSLNFVTRTANLDGTGDLELRDLSPGSYQVTIKAFGKKPHRVAVKLFAGRETSIGIDSPISLEPLEPDSLASDNNQSQPSQENKQTLTEAHGSSSSGLLPDHNQESKQILENGQTLPAAHAQTTTAGNSPNNKTGSPLHLAPQQSLDLLVPVPRLQTATGNTNKARFLPENEPLVPEKENTSMPGQPESIPAPERHWQPKADNTEWSTGNLFTLKQISGANRWKRPAHQDL